MGTRKQPPTRFRRVRRRLIVERLDQRRVLAAITGTVFGDANHSFQFDDVEAGAPARLVYLDVDQNGQLDSGDPYALSEADGTFAFADLDDGSYLVRLFNGASTQFQTIPIEAAVQGDAIEVLEAVQLDVIGETVVALTDSAIIIGDLSTGTSETVEVGDQLSKMQRLPDGNFLVIGTDGSGDTAWIVDAESMTIAPLALSESDPPIEWSDIAIDSDGNGVALDQSSGEIYSVTTIGSSVAAIHTSQSVAAESQVLTARSGVLSVFGEPDGDGMKLSLWSNQSNLFVTENPVPASGLSSLLSFDSVSNILAARNLAGGTSVYDVANNFQLLYSSADLDGPVAIDGARDLLLSISPTEEVLSIIDLRDGDLIAELAVDLSTVGEVAAIAMSDREDSVVVLGAAGIVELGLKQPTAHEIVITNGLDPDPVLFGVAIDGSNSAPSYLSQPHFEAIEDTLLELAAPAALTNVIDAAGDTYVLLQVGPATQGTATVGVDGSIAYQPNPDFFGSDSVPVRIHDGQHMSQVFDIVVSVAGVPDDPTDIDIDANPFPENAPIGIPVGDIQVIDVDGGVHTIGFNDPRFDHVGGKIIFIGGGNGIDFEEEPFIPLTISATDPETGTTIEKQIVLSIQDRNDPVTAISPTSGFVDENDKGAIVAELDVADQDGEQAHFLTVDDDRFIIENEVLRLAPGVALDYELEPTVLINITAKEIPGGGTYTESFTVEVRDQLDTPQVLDLSGKTVLEFEPGAVVGEVTIGGQTPGPNYQFSVDDPRFEFDGSTLKLNDDDYVIRYNQDEILVAITAIDTGGGQGSLSDEFVVDVLINQKPFHNESNPYDVDGSGDASAVDALVIINYMGEYGPGPVGSGDPGMGYDVNGDGEVTALDALLVINQLNRARTGTVIDTEGEGEGEQQPIAPAPRIVVEDDRPASPPSEPPSSLQPGNPLKIVDTDSIDLEFRQLDKSEIAAQETKRQFAKNVDRTLRLLSDDT